MSELTHEEDIKKHVRVYLAVFGALAVLTVVTVAVAYLHLSIWPALIMALLIASIKGGLVAGYFMHLVSEKKVIFWILLLTAAFLFFMFLLFISAFHDQATAMWNPDLPHSTLHSIG
ncbi:MAG: cytochrome C oxidase subunit IV family protein [Rhodothermales bacterium]